MVSIVEKGFSLFLLLYRASKITGISIDCLLTHYSLLNSGQAQGKAVEISSNLLALEVYVETTRWRCHKSREIDALSVANSSQAHRETPTGGEKLKIIWSIQSI